MPQKLSLLQRLFTLRNTVPVIRLEGHIESGARGPSARALNIAGTSRVIDRAFAFPRSVAVALVINSPGGSAAQSHLIAERIVRLSKEKNKPVYAFVEDSAASGGYILALAAHEIYCNPFSLVGSIGVIHSSFGFQDAIQKLGIERRLKTAGKHKSLLDPFSKETEEDNRRIREILDSMHAQFKGYVKQRRGSKLKQPDEVLFEGDIWLGEKAVEYGLADGIGDVRTVLRAKFGPDILLPLIAPPPRFPFPVDVGASTTVSNLVSELRGSAYWQKLGL